jgi:hypothetical protein
MDATEEVVDEKYGSDELCAVLRVPATGGTYREEVPPTTALCDKVFNPGGGRTTAQFHPTVLLALPAKYSTFVPPT